MDGNVCRGRPNLTEYLLRVLVRQEQDGEIQKRGQTTNIAARGQLLESAIGSSLEMLGLWLLDSDNKHLFFGLAAGGEVLEQ